MIPIRRLTTGWSGTEQGIAEDMTEQKDASGNDSASDSADAAGDERPAKNRRLKIWGIVCMIFSAFMAIGGRGNPDERASADIYLFAAALLVIGLILFFKGGGKVS